MPITANTHLITNGILNGLPQSDPNIFRGVVTINMQITLCLNRHINQRMLGKLLKHMIKKTNPCRNVTLTCTIKVYLNANIRFFCFTADFTRARHNLALSF